MTRGSARLAWRTLRAVFGHAHRAKLPDEDLFAVAPVAALLEEDGSRRAQSHGERDRRAERPARGDDRPREEDVEDALGRPVDPLGGVHDQVGHVFLRERQREDERHEEALFFEVEGVVRVAHRAHELGDVPALHRGDLAERVGRCREVEGRRGRTRRGAPRASPAAARRPASSVSRRATVRRSRVANLAVGVGRGEQHVGERAEQLFVRRAAASSSGAAPSGGRRAATARRRGGRPRVVAFTFALRGSPRRACDSRAVRPLRQRHQSR